MPRIFTVVFSIFRFPHSNGQATTTIDAATAPPMPPHVTKDFATNRLNQQKQHKVPQLRQLQKLRQQQLRQRIRIKISNNTPLEGRTGSRTAGPTTSRPTRNPNHPMKSVDNCNPKTANILMNAESELIPAIDLNAICFSP